MSGHVNDTAAAAGGDRLHCLFPFTPHWHLYAGCGLQQLLLLLLLLLFPAPPPPPCAPEPPQPTCLISSLLCEACVGTSITLLLLLLLAGTGSLDSFLYSALASVRTMSRLCPCMAAAAVHPLPTPTHPLQLCPLHTPYLFQFIRLVVDMCRHLDHTVAAAAGGHRLPCLFPVLSIRL